MFKKILKIIFIMIIFLFSDIVYAESENMEETFQNQMEEFGIQTFIKNANEYKGTFFEDIDINEILNSAISGEIKNEKFIEKILNLLGQEAKTGIKTLLSILIIIVIHSILKSISENLENDTIANLIYYVQYIAIVTIILSNFSDIITLVKDTASQLVGFMNCLIPILISLMLFTGSITTSGIIEPILLFMTNLIGNLMQTVLIPITLLIAVFCIISKISDKIQINQIANFMKSGVIWFLGIILTIFVGVLSLEGTLSSSVDGITAKTAKAVVSTAVPVVGKILGDAIDSVLGCGIILKNAVGFVGVVIIVGICIVPIIKLGILTISYKLVSGICEPIADGKIVKLLDQMGDIFKILLAILASISVMLIIGTTLVIKISNSGMMYR